jgi:ParB family chromosome partitioning protein
LGRGLGALIPTAPAPAPVAATAPAPVGAPPPDSQQAVEPTPDLRAPEGASFAEIPLEQIRPNPRQPREQFDEDALAELMASIREVGVLQPVVVRPVADGFELVMGERRWRACRELGLPAVPAIVRSTADDAMLLDALLENLHRQELNPLEEAAAYQQLLAEFGATHEGLADRIGRSRSHVTNTMRLLGLPPAVQRRVAAGVLSAGHARALLGLPDPEAQERLAARIVAEGLSVRATEEAVAMGGPSKKRSKTARARGVGGPFADVAARLSDRFETRVLVDMGRTRGRITVDFAGADDLRRILAAMAPDVAAELPGD